MLTRTEPMPESDNVFGGGAAPAFSVPNFPAILRRQWRLIATGCGLGLILAVTYILLATPLYTATATVMLDTRMNQVLQKQDIIADAPVDTGLVDSQVEVLTSESIALAVIRKFDLAHDSEFVGPPSHLGAQIIWQTQLFIQGVKNALGLKPDVVVGPDTLAERTAVDTFLKRLTATRVGLTYVIDIAYDSESPEKAALIANAVANTYMSAELEARYASTRGATTWLQNRLTELKTQATTADAALQSFKSANNIVDTGRGLLNEQQLSDLNSQLVVAKTQTAEAKARLDRIQSASRADLPDVTVSDALTNNVITRLRSQYLDLAATEADLQSRLGPNHQTVVKVRDQMNQLRDSIRNEVQRIASAYYSDYQIAVAREKSLNDSMANLVGEAGLNSQAQVKMRELQSSSDAYRSLYDSFLQKFQETTQQQTIPVTDSRIITVATEPLLKSKPKTLLVLAAGLCLGAFMGAGIGLAREIVVDVFRTPEQVEAATGFTCLGILPFIFVRSKRWFWSQNSSRGSSGDVAAIAEHVLDAPLSRFSETLRNIKVKITSIRLMRDCKVIGIVSAVSREGKSTVAANLGAIVASSGVRTLLIDGDVRRQFLTKAFAPTAENGLIEALDDPSQLASLVCQRTRSGLDVLPCVTSTVVDSADLLGSARMASLLMAARETYDYVFIELAPIASVVDAKAIAHLADAFILVVEWGKSKKDLVIEALADTEAVRERLIGIVLNKADPVAVQRNEAYKGKTFKDYYVD